MSFVAICTIILLSSASVFAEQPITVYLAGDSTMAEKLPEKRPETGWGEALQQKENSDNRSGEPSLNFICVVFESMKNG